jgi:hypothetical protein
MFTAAVIKRRIYTKRKPTVYPNADRQSVSEQYFMSSYF